MQANGVTLHCEEAGAGPQTVLFLHSLLLSGLMWQAAVAALAPAYRCVTLDFRGQGRSPVTADGYDMDTLAQDVAAAIPQLGGPVHLVGLSMGGYVALRIAARRPDLVRSLVLMDTAAEAETAWDQLRYRLLAVFARLIGFRPMAGRVMPLLFGQTFLRDPARAAERDAWRARILGNDRTGALRALAGVLARPGVEKELRQIRAPTLVMVGEEDVATPPARARRIQAGIAGSDLVTIPRAGHSAPIEQPGFVNAALQDFLRRVEGKAPCAS